MLRLLNCARDAAGLVLFGLPIAIVIGRKNRSGAEPEAARCEAGAQIKE